MTEPGADWAQGHSPPGRRLPGIDRTAATKHRSPGVKRKLKQMTLSHILSSIHKICKSKMEEKQLNSGRFTVTPEVPPPGLERPGLPSPDREEESSNESRV